MAKEGDPCINPECGKTEADGAVFGVDANNSLMNKAHRSTMCLDCRRARRREKEALRQRYEPQYEPGDPDAPLKECSACWVPKPATQEHFPRDRRRKDGFTQSRHRGECRWVQDMSMLKFIL